MLAEPPTPSSRTSHNSAVSPGGASGSAEGGYISGGLSIAGIPPPPQTLQSLTSIVRPYAWDYLENGGMTLVYADDEGHQTVQEAFLPNTYPRIPGATPETETQPPPAKPRTQSDLIKILHVISDIVSVLEVAHNSGVTHNNVNTFSIIVVGGKNGERMRGKLGGWHLASKLEREEMGRAAGGAMLRGENPAPLQYIAPECTGRMNRAVDWRADFYSLGISMYELVVGYLPFRSTEPLELIHMHIAQQPKPPNEVNASIPEAISAIVMKLLKKNAEERYQTGSGLRADLQLMIRLLTEGKPLCSVNIGELDTSSTFMISEKLYGREDHVKQLHEAYEGCLKTGGCTIVTIQGSSGVGKSRLVNEIQRPVVEKKGYAQSSGTREARWLTLPDSSLPENSISTSADFLFLRLFKRFRT